MLQRSDWWLAWVAGVLTGVCLAEIGLRIWSR